jgi:hypothetical protein
MRGCIIRSFSHHEAVDAQLVQREVGRGHPEGGSRGHLGLYPIVTLQYSSTTLYQVSYHIR